VFPLTLVVFFVSGFAALLYQVVWQRLLAIFSGTDVYSATVIVAAFMGGLGIGHLAGGHLADRVSRRACLILFAGAEAAIALFGLFSAALYYDVLYQRLGPLALGRGAVAVVLFGSLLWPTFFMGASLPLLAKAMTNRIGRAASTIGALYGVNTLGAAAGAVGATWMLLPALGLEGSLHLGAALNAACAAAIAPAALWLRRTPGADGRVEPEPAPDVSPDAALPFRTWALLYALAGFVALSYEIVWFRLLGVTVKSTAFTFGTLLAVYLAGLGSGAAVGSRVAPRLQRPDVAFLVLQTAAGLTAAVLVALLVSIADDVGALRSYFGGYEPLSVRDSVHALRTAAGNVLRGTYSAADVPANFLRFYVAVPLLLVFPPTFLMGSAFPCLQRAVHTEIGTVGRRVGTLLLANIAGSILGTVITGSLALSVLGTAAMLRVLVLASGVFAVTAVVRSRRVSRVPAPASASAASDISSDTPVPRDTEARKVGVGAAVAVAAMVVAVAASMPDSETLWSRLHGTTPARMILAEDDSGVSVIKGETDGLAGRKIVFVNGVGQSLIPYGDVHTALGAVPALLHPNPRSVAVVGLGSGDTAYAASARPETTRVVCIEIIRPQLATLRDLTARDPYGGLRALLRDERVEHVFGDGRAYLMRSSSRFDIIEADALRPTSAYAGNLYSEAYFTLVRERLARGGIAATWVPTQRVYDTFVQVFPYVLSVPGILLGSREPFGIDADAVSARLSDPRIRQHFERAGIDIVSLMNGYLTPLPTPIGPGSARVPVEGINTDLFPRDEFDLRQPRR
jgi:spermidine synthase